MSDELALVVGGNRHRSAAIRPLLVAVYELLQKFEKKKMRNLKLSRIQEISKYNQRRKILGMWHMAFYSLFGMTAGGQQLSLFAMYDDKGSA